MAGWGGDSCPHRAQGCGRSGLQQSPLRANSTTPFPHDPAVMHSPMTAPHSEDFGARDLRSRDTWSPKLSGAASTHGPVGSYAHRPRCPDHPAWPVCPLLPELEPLLTSGDTLLPGGGDQGAPGTTAVVGPCFPVVPVPLRPGCHSGGSCARNRSSF